MRRHFARRVGLVLALFFGLAILASTIAHAVLSGSLGGGERRGLVVPAAVLGLVILFLGFASVVRSIRRVTRPVGDVMEAADRVASGDYTARVEERGSNEMRRLARSFNAMTERLSSSENQRRNLLADLAHELRTPLSVIRGNVEGILDGLYLADQTTLEPVLDETKVLSRLLDDLETLSTAEAGALRLHREPTDPGRLVEDAVAAFRPDAHAAGLALEAKVANVLPTLDVDPVRIGQVLSNLLSNAVRHTLPGGTVVVQAEHDPRGSVVFTVRDTGRGIAPAVLPHVFDRFVKEAGSGGAGLGLAIAKSLVEAHEGEISADSAPGKGTTLRFVLPVRGGDRPRMSSG